MVETISRAQGAGTAVTEKINATVDDLIQAVETCHKMLLKQAGKIKQGKRVGKREARLGSE